MFESKILADSVDALGNRLTTFVVTAPRIILAEINTHRMLSRNSASSRAIPIVKSIEAVLKDPFIPEEFGKNQAGMSASENLTADKSEAAELVWLGAKREAVKAAEHLVDLEVHKGLGNRLLEPFKWHTCILTATDWSNFFALRTDANAQPEFRKLALMMQEQYQEIPYWIHTSDNWHVPLVDFHELMGNDDGPIDWGYWKLVSVGRCARVSYLTHLGKRDPDADVALAKRLMTNGHLSPFEHVARPFNPDERRLVEDLGRYLHDSGWIGTPNTGHARYLLDKIEYCANFRGWHSLRADIPNEHDFSLTQI